MSRCEVDDVLTTLDIHISVGIVGDEQLRQWKRRSRITYDADRDVYIKSCKNIVNLTA